MVIEWLQKRVTVAEAAHMVQNDRPGPEPVAFGLQNDRWRRLVEQFREGDELWEYRRPPEKWANMAGRAGYCIVRDGKVVASIVTLIN